MLWARWKDEEAIVDQTVATGSQPDTSHRWGDYSSMTIDLDGCTFWYINQYYTVDDQVRLEHPRGFAEVRRLYA